MNSTEKEENTVETEQVTETTGNLEANGIESVSLENKDFARNERREGEEFVHPDRISLRREGEAKRRAIEAEFRKINAIDPSVKSFDDLMLMENAEEFAEKVRRGYSLTDAFILANRKQLTHKIKTSAVRAALAKLGAKQHLTGAGTSGGETAVDVPAETYSLYKSLYPNITDGEIKKHFKSHNR